MEFKKVCPMCQSEDVNVMSAVEKQVERKAKVYRVVELTNICNRCGYTKDSVHYLYAESEVN